MEIHATEITLQDGSPKLTIKTPAGQPDIILVLWLDCGPHGFIDANGDRCAKHLAAVRAVDVTTTSPAMKALIHTNGSDPAEVSTENPYTTVIHNPATITTTLI